MQPVRCATEPRLLVGDNGSNDSAEYHYDETIEDPFYKTSDDDFHC